MAMTPEDCKARFSVIAGKISALEELRLAPDVTEDGWCRIIDGPLGAGLEWKLGFEGRDFTLDLRQNRFVFEDLGPFALTGRLATGDNRLSVVPLRLTSGRGDVIALSAVLGMGGSPAPGFALTEARLAVAGEAGLVNEVLAWAFRQDLAAARSSLIAARDQREYMLDWLNDEALRMIDPASAEAFGALVAAYPRARGVAQIAAREDRPVEIGGLMNAVLFGNDFSRAQAAQLIEDAGLRFTWQSE
jgi:hypothetical protein